MRNWIIGVAVVANIGVWGTAYVGFTKTDATGSQLNLKNMINLRLLNMEAVGKMEDGDATHALPVTVTLLVRDTADIGRICKFSRRLKTSFRKTFQKEPIEIAKTKRRADFDDVKPLLVEAANRTLDRTSVADVNLTTSDGQTSAIKKVRKLALIKCTQQPGGLGKST